MKKKIFILGGDGFCGWPTCIELAREGHDIFIIDSLIRRKWDREMCNSLVPISSPLVRTKSLSSFSSGRIRFLKIDIANDYEALLKLFKKQRPDIVIDFAKQRSAPFSMLSSATARFTMQNNINSTHNVLVAAVESNIHPLIIHLGTMGVYGYTHQNEIPEGFAAKDILFPSCPGSIYHLTKAQDQLSLFFYAKNYRLNIVELHQGIIWGQHALDDNLPIELRNRFDYDGEFGTVLNRFCAQAIASVPLTIYGNGKKQRAFIHISDMIRNLQKIISRSNQYSGLSIMNQFTEVLSLNEIASMVEKLNPDNSKIINLPNPRNEDEFSTLKASNTSLINNIENYTKVSPAEIDNLLKYLGPFAKRINKKAFLTRASWKGFRTAK